MPESREHVEPADSKPLENNGQAKHVATRGGMAARITQCNGEWLGGRTGWSVSDGLDVHPWPDGRTVSAVPEEGPSAVRPKPYDSRGEKNIMDHAALLARIAELEAAVKATKRVNKLTLKVSEKGAVSVYGMGRFPVTLYGEQWERLLDHKDEILAFLKANKSALKVKGEEVAA